MFTNNFKISGMDINNRCDIDAVETKTLHIQQMKQQMRQQMKQHTKRDKNFAYTTVATIDAILMPWVTLI